MEKDYIEKIRKLLALAESPNEHEARAALLKARELMAEHKLSEREVRDASKQKVMNIDTEITCSKRRNPWIVYMSGVIGENYCCKGYRSHIKGRQTQSIGFIGLEDDIEICMTVFKYAVDCTLSQIKRIKKENAEYYHGYVTRLCDSYGFGFAYGLKLALEVQREEKAQEWGLVLVTPKEVEEASSYLGKEEFNSRSEEDFSTLEFANGYRDGQQFDPSRRIQEEAAQA